MRTVIAQGVGLERRGGGRVRPQAAPVNAGSRMAELDAPGAATVNGGRKKLTSANRAERPTPRHSRPQTSGPSDMQ